jgi:FkbM family methyltransferase
MKNTTNQTSTTKFYSQCGEDKFLANYLKNKKATKIIVEIGAGLPEEFSNSNYFIANGYKACLIEPNHMCYTRLVDYYKENQDVKIYQTLISDAEGVTELDISNQHWALGKEATAESKVKQVVGKNTLINILKDFGQKQIGIMSLDIEGGESKILQQLIDSKYRPEILLVESLNEQATKDIEAVISKEYELLEVLSLTRIYKCK